MTSITWTMTTEPLQPLVKATMKADLWQMETETLVNTSLSVFANSWLTLFCMASYPVFWYKNEHEELPFQTRNCNRFLEKNLTFCKNVSSGSQDENFIPAITQYESILDLGHAMAHNIAGNYFCAEAGTVKAGLATRIQLSVHNLALTADYPQIIQTGFDHIRLAPSSLHVRRRENVELILSFVYTMPNGMEVNQSIFQIYQQKLVYLWPQTGNFGDESDIAGTTINIEKLSKNICQITLIITEIALFYRYDDYQFILEGQHKNGSVYKASYNFKLNLNNFENFKYLERTKRPFVATATLRIGRFYEIQLHWQSEKKSDKASVIVLKQNSLTCLAKDVVVLHHHEAFEKCGVIGISLVNETLNKSEVAGVQIFLKATNQCVLLAETFMNLSVPKEMVALSISVLDENLIPQTSNGAHVVTIPPGIRSGDAVFVGETITLRCLIANCLQVPTFHWSQRHVRVDKYTEKTEQFHSLELNESRHLLNTYTMALDLTFAPISKDHKGTYGCTTYNAWAPSLILTLFTLSVEEPLAPAFENGKEFGVTERILKQGADLSLICKVTGRPTPDISWTRKEKEGTIVQIDSRRITNDNSTLRVSDPGFYVCNATNPYGVNGQIFHVRYEEGYLPLYTTLPLVVLVLSGAGFLVWWLRRRSIDASLKELAEFLKHPPEELLIDSDVPLSDQIELVPYNRNYEIEKIAFSKTDKMLGEGAFALVYSGKMKVGDIDWRMVAVMVPKESSNVHHYRALSNVMKIMSQLHPHINVLSLLGAYTDNMGNRELFVLTELCENGSLKDYLLRRSKKNLEGQYTNAPAVATLLNYAFQAANGMEHLAAQRIIHRDVALRNLLLTGQQIVKVSDFGLSRRETLYRKRIRLTSDQLPIFWMAPEALMDYKYSQKSDVWSFGVLLWEMFNCGEDPYPEDEEDNSFAGFTMWLVRGNRLSPPKIACDEMYQLMRKCWNTNPDDRPNFSECIRIISECLEKHSPSTYRSMLLDLAQGAQRSPPSHQLENNNSSAVSQNETSITAEVAVPSFNGLNENLENHTETSPTPMQIFEGAVSNADKQPYVRPNDPVVESDTSL